MIIKLAGCLVPQCNGADHTWEFTKFRLKEMELLQETVGMEVDEFEEALNKGGLSVQAIRAMRVLIMLMHRRIGVLVELDDVDAEFDALDFIADPESEEKPTDTPTATSLQPAAEPATSSTSGPAPAVESEPKSSPTPLSSGGGTASP